MKAERLAKTDKRGGCTCSRLTLKYSNVGNFENLISEYSNEIFQSWFLRAVGEVKISSSHGLNY